MTWISVKDRLPKIGDWVLVSALVTDGSNCFDVIPCVRFCEEHGDHNCDLRPRFNCRIYWRILLPNGYYDAMKKYEITHWMPLPKGPEDV
jgi:hypothetical protein